MKYSLYLMLITLLGCHPKNENTIGPEQSANAFIYDSSMYADGCELHLQLDLDNSSHPGTLYKFTSATVPLVQRVIAEASPDPNEMLRLPVKLRYVATTNQSVLQCGWVSPTVTEIKILEISKR